MSSHLRVVPKVAIVGFLGLSGCAGPSVAGVNPDGQVLTTRVASPEFQQNWYDGKAEIAGYDLITPRYGSPRTGVAVTVFVTEPFSNSARVKADPGKHAPADEVPVMKLNLIEDFPTGIYDYNLMTSAFVALAPVNQRPAGSPAKVSFSAQEWCGHAYEQLLFDASAIRYTGHSYFDGEADSTGTLEFPRDGVSEDVLLFWARSMAGPFLEPGESRDLPLLRSLKNARLLHSPVKWEQARFARSTDVKKVTVPAGTFECETWTVELPGEPSGKPAWMIDAERAFPHRIVRWQTSAGESAELLGVDRLTYWQMNAPGFEQAVKKFGLSPRPPRTP